MTFTPLIGLTALETYAGTQLANFKELEAAYSTYWKASTSAADKKSELTNTISKNNQNIDSLRKKQADVLVQQQASLVEFNVLAAQRSTANNILNRASDAFKLAVNRARANEPTFLELLGMIASTVVNVGADVAGVSKIIGEHLFCRHACPHLEPTVICSCITSLLYRADCPVQYVIVLLLQAEIISPFKVSSLPFWGIR